MAHALIAGWGYVGSRAGYLLREAGFRVTGIRRTPRGTDLSGGITVIAADLNAKNPIPLSLPEDITHVVYAVGADRFTPEAYRSAYVDGLIRLTDVLRCRKAAIERFCFVSSTSVYPQQDGKWVEESSPVGSRHFGAETLIEAERFALSLPWQVTVVRLGGIYGPGRTRLIDAVRAGKARRIPNQTRLLNLIHGEDAAAAIVHLLTHPDPPPICNVTDLEPVDRNDLLVWIANGLGLLPPPWEETAEPLVPVRGGNRRVSSRLLQSLGFRHRWPTYREGYRPLLESAAGNQLDPLQSGA
jgi:nucleoside-diphosphate-sugar epimerase